MNKDINFLNSKEAADVLGVNVSSIKRWTDSGRLECIQTAGGHRKFLMSHLVKFIEENDTKSSKAHVFPLECETDVQIGYHVLKGDFDSLTDHTVEKALLSDRFSVQKVLNGLYLSHLPLHAIYDRLVAQVLKKIGTLWMNGKISVIEEHLAAQTMRDTINRLQGIICLPTEKSGRAVFMNLSTELHDIALKMVENIMEVRGFQTYFSGQMTPLIDIEQIFGKLKPDRLYISSTYITDQEATQKEADRLFGICREHGIRIYVGGRGWDVLSYDNPAVELRLYSFEETNRT
jgi:excisionase family DNA binding protein